MELWWVARRNASFERTENNNEIYSISEEEIFLIKSEARRRWFHGVATALYECRHNSFVKSSRANPI